MSHSGSFEQPVTMTLCVRNAFAEQEQAAEGVGVSGRADRLAGCQPGGSKGHQKTPDTA